MSSRSPYCLLINVGLKEVSLAVQATTSYKIATYGYMSIEEDAEKKDKPWSSLFSVQSVCQIEASIGHIWRSELPSNKCC